MSTNTPRMDPPKTECRFCGNVWQEHTLNQVDACMAKIKLEISEALARKDTLQSEASVDPLKVICPACSKPFGEHTKADLISCADKFPKRERGPSGLEYQNEFIEGHFEGEEPDPVKRAKIRAQTLQLLCSCGKALGDHTVDESLACSSRDREGNG